jgi:hypothetical protein
MAPELLDPSTGSTHMLGTHDDFSMTDEEYFGPELTKETDVYAFSLLSLEVSPKIFDSFATSQKRVCVIQT